MAATECISDMMKAMQMLFSGSGPFWWKECYDVGSHHTWLAIELVHIQNTLTVVTYRGRILLPHIIFMQRTSSCTTMLDHQVCHDYLGHSRFNVLPWPLYSPDLNPIEHPWDALDQRVRRGITVPDAHEQLVLALQEEWHTISHCKMDSLIASKLVFIITQHVDSKRMLLSTNLTEG